MLTQLKTFAHDHLFICNEIHDLARLYLSFGNFHLYRSSVFQSFFGILGHFIPSRPSFSFQLLRKHWSLKVVLRVRTGEREFGASQNIKFKFPCLPTYYPSYQHL